jgi:L-ascorbate metabolism protein UlaG (beta-lactamase superfamily)
MGHSAFRLRGKDVTIVTDPFSPDAGLSMGKVAADIVTVSHKGPSAAHVQGVANVTRVIDGPGEYEVGGVLITGVATDSEPMKGARNTVYVMRLEDISVCHLGGLRAKLSNQQIEELGEVDVLLIPAGGGDALGPDQAAQVVAQVEPTLVIPMHFHLDGNESNGLEPVDTFMREMGSKEFIREPKLNVTRTSLGSDPKVSVLEQRRV